LTSDLDIAIISSIKVKALKRRVHAKSVWREPCLLEMGNMIEMEDGL